MRNILTTTQLHNSCREWGRFNGAAEAHKLFGKAELAQIALASPTLTDEGRRDAYNAMVQGFAAGAHLKTYMAQRTHKNPIFNFVPLTFSETSKAGKAFKQRLMRAAYVLTFTSEKAEAAEAYAAKLVAPKIEHTPSRKDKVATFAKKYAAIQIAFEALSPTMRIDVLATVKTLKAAKAAK
jgi:hypothetical protein